MNIEEILRIEEKQSFDFKSINIDPKKLAINIVAFANADGGTLAIGISDNTRRIEGTDYEILKLNELLRVPFDFCIPTVKVRIEKIPCVDFMGRSNHVVLMIVEPSAEVHANQADEVFMRVGDKSKKLTFEERTQLVYDKGERFYEDKPVHDATVEDIDLNFVREYIKKIGYSKSPYEFLRENKGFLKEKDGVIHLSTAAILLFGKDPQTFFPRARVRFIRYEGEEEKFGAEMNVIKDVIFEGNILKLVRDSVSFLDTQIKEKTYLGKDGLFITEEEYPKFVRQEIVVNAVTHRDYSIMGADIQIKIFNDRIVVESPGKLPGLVRADNIRQTHFSRNPKIAEFLKIYNYVKEYGEGVDRMYKEMDAAGLCAPEYYGGSFILKVTIYNSSPKKEKSVIEVEKSVIGDEKSVIGVEKSVIENQKLDIQNLEKKLQRYRYNEPTSRNILKIYFVIDTNQIFSTSEVVKILGCSYSTASEIMSKLREMKVVKDVKGKGKGKCRFINTGEIGEE